MSEGSGKPLQLISTKIAHALKRELFANLFSLQNLPDSSDREQERKAQGLIMSVNWLVFCYFVGLELVIQLSVSPIQAVVRHNVLR